MRDMGVARRAEGEQVFPTDTPSKLSVYPWITVAIQGSMTYLTGVCAN